MAALKARSIKASVSKNGKMIKKFDSSDTSRLLLKFLRPHPSCRVVFNAMVKAGFVNLSDILTRLKDLSKDSQTSFIVSSKCQKCGNVLDVPNLVDSNFKVREKQISCPICWTRNSLNSARYAPFFETFSKEQLIRVLKRGEGIGLLTKYVTIECPFCGFTKELLQEDMTNTNLRCQSCGDICETLLHYIPAHPESIKLLTNDNQGYWLEWYVWKLLSDVFSAEPDLILSKNNQTIEADVVCLVKNRIFIVECKDTGDIKDFLEALPVMGKMADKVFLISTRNIRPRTLVPAKSILGKRFLYVPPKNLENISRIIKRS